MLRYTKLSVAELDELTILLIKNITFINEALLPEAIIAETETLLQDIDLNDTPFVALTKHLNGKLWTGDKRLTLGLKPKNFIELLNTVELAELHDWLERS